MADLSIMYQPLAGGWVKLGTQHGGGRGVMAESIRLEGDRGEGGCLSCSFKLKQDPRWIQTEMEKATPIVVMDGAEAVWSGRIAETPMTFGEDDIEVGVNAQGWWQHLKDDCTDREWVVEDLSRWVDPRSLPAANLGAWNLAASLESSGGAIVSKIGSGSAAPQNKGQMGIMLDLGPNNRAKRIVFNMETNNITAASQLLYARTSSLAEPIGAPGSYTDAIGGSGSCASAATTYRGTFSVGERYVSIFIYYTGASTTYGLDTWIKFNWIRVFTDTADESGDASILKASTVISETLDACAPLISPRRDRITTTALSLPQFPGSPGWRYADELIRQANAPHGYLARLTPDPVPVFEYGAIPTDYRFVLGEGQYTLLEPAAQALQGVASRVITEYEDASGVRSESIAQQSSAVLSRSQFANPGFETNTSNWSATIGSITRDTGAFDQGTASARVTTAGVGNIAYVRSASVQLAPNKLYRVKFAFRRLYALGPATMVYPCDGVNQLNTVGTYTGAAASAAMIAQSTGSFTTHTIDFITGSAGLFELWFDFYAAPSVDVGYIDSFVIYEFDGTVVGRRGFRRTFLRPMSQRSTAATAQAIAQLELDAAQYPPFKGTIGVTGRIPLKGGGSMDVSHLPACVGDNILLNNLHDPNTQGLGRIGNIQSCVYDHDKRQAIVGIDRDLSFITELKSRLSLFAR